MILHCLQFYAGYNDNVYYTIIGREFDLPTSIIQQVGEYIYNDITIVSTDSEYIKMLMRSGFGE